VSCLFALTLVFAVLILFVKGKERGSPKESQVAPDPRVRYGQIIKRRAGTASGISDPTGGLRCSGVDPAHVNLDLALGTPGAGRFGGAARRRVARRAVSLNIGRLPIHGRDFSRAITICAGSAVH
jgi:hypothetical protein